MTVGPTGGCDAAVVPARLLGLSPIKLLPRAARASTNASLVSLLFLAPYDTRALSGEMQTLE